MQGKQIELSEYDSLPIKEISIDSIKKLLYTYIHLQPNDDITRKELENYLPGAICDSKLNTPDTIDRGVIIFKYKGFLFEFGQELKCFCL